MAAQLSVFPNPSKDRLVVRMDEGRSFEVKVYDTNGKALFLVGEGTGQIVLEVAHLSAGIYLLEIRSGEMDRFEKWAKSVQ